MADYSFITKWKFEEPIEAVWDEIYHPERWPDWWKYVENASEIQKGDDLGIGSKWKYTWKTRLFYKFTFLVETNIVDPPFRLEGIAKGDLEGIGKWLLEYKSGYTVVKYEWVVKTNKSWMNLLAPVAYIFFKWNHSTVMEEGYKGLKKKLKKK
ncbi:MAG: SRPBCC family protein [Thermodesulfobacteriota bacterium]